MTLEARLARPLRAPAARRSPHSGSGGARARCSGLSRRHGRGSGAGVTDALRETPLAAAHRALGARMVPFAGWSMPVQYEGLVAEHHAVRQRAGLFDVSHMGELELEGPEALAVIDELVTNDLRAAAIGQAVYTCCCDERGGTLDDLIVYKRGEERILVVCNASNREKISAHVARHAAGRAAFRDASDATALLALQGPRAFAVLDAVGTEPAPLGQALRPFRLCDARVAGVECVVARTGYTGEDGVELFCAWDRAAALWSALMEAGRPLGLAPAGLGARDTLRLEARLCLYGHELDEDTTPLEAGLAWVVKLGKPRFVGKDALAAAAAAPLRKQLVGFEVTGRGIARSGYPLQDSAGAVVGTCTSGSPSPTLGKNLGLGWVPPGLTAVGTRLQVDCRGKPVEAVVVPTPFYKRPRAG
ncbi:MAG: glycine cleavage system aminomethyltransferase GcvT [Polyangiaceae bacterium]|nr:glycine cleavage system aminomethyltransferase GcvT [Polyangiaceae bacterium]